MTGENVVLSGMRSTGKLHLGNYFGAVRNWVDLQDRYDCYYFVADWHALTTDDADPSRIADNTLEVVADYLASGLDPERSVIFVQSLVPEHAELHLLLSMITPLGWLERVPTYKEQRQQLADRDLSTYGFLGYPLLQSADIIIYKADAVPVGVPAVGEIGEVRPLQKKVCHFFEIPPGARHTALGDAHCTAEIFLRMLDILPHQGVITLQDAVTACNQVFEIRRLQEQF